MVRFTTASLQLILDSANSVTTRCLCLFFNIFGIKNFLTCKNILTLDNLISTPYAVKGQTVKRGDLFCSANNPCLHFFA